jgi:hypothetical protein
MLKKWSVCGQDSAGSGQGLVICVCEYSNEYTGNIKGGKCLSSRAAVTLLMTLFLVTVFICCLETQNICFLPSLINYTN